MFLEAAGHAYGSRRNRRKMVRLTPNVKALSVNLG